MLPRGSPRACRSYRVTSVPPRSLPQRHPKTHNPADTVSMEIDWHTLWQHNVFRVAVGVIRVNGSNTHEPREGISQRRVGAVGLKTRSLDFGNGLPHCRSRLGMEVQPAREKSCDLAQHNIRNNGLLIEFVQHNI